MSILDWIILIILVIVGTLGFIFGAKKRLIKKIGWLGGFVIAFLFYSMLANLIISKTPLGEAGANFFSEKMLSQANGDGNMTAILNSNYQNVVSQAGGYDTLTKGLTAMNVPGFFASYFISKIFYTTGTVSMALGSGVVGAIAYPVTFIVLYIVSSLVLVLVLKFLTGADDGKVGIADRIGGVLLRVAEVSITLLILMMVLIGISYAAPPMDAWLREQVHFDDGTVTIASVYYRVAWQIINAFKLLAAR